MGSKLSETLINEIEILEKRPNPEKVSMVVDVSTAPNQTSMQHRKATTEELLAMSDNPFEARIEAGIEVKPRVAVEELSTSNMSLFINRIWWALLVVAMIFCADVIIQVMIARQQVGVSIFEFQNVQFYMDRLDEMIFDLSQWFSTSLDGIVPH